MMFLTNFEVPVITTALVAITGDLGGFDISSWIVASYLLGYVGGCPQMTSRKPKRKAASRKSQSTNTHIYN